MPQVAGLRALHPAVPRRKSHPHGRRLKVVATLSSVTSQHVFQAIAEYDERGDEQFLELYGFEASPTFALIHDVRRYDAQAVLGVAHRFATGRLATPDEVGNEMPGALGILRRRGFEVSEPTTPVRTEAKKATRAPRAPRSAPRPVVPRPPARSDSARADLVREERLMICPTCFTALPGTGICDACS